MSVCKIHISQGQRNTVKAKLHAIIPNPNFMAKIVLFLLRLFSHPNGQTNHFSRWMENQKKKKRGKRKGYDTQISPPLLGSGHRARMPYVEGMLSPHFK